jgi:hypothetical protein
MKEELKNRLPISIASALLGGLFLFFGYGLLLFPGLLMAVGILSMIAGSICVVFACLNIFFPSLIAPLMGANAVLTESSASLTLLLTVAGVITSVFLFVIRAYFPCLICSFFSVFCLALFGPFELGSLVFSKFFNKTRRCEGHLRVLYYDAAELLLKEEKYEEAVEEFLSLAKEFPGRNDPYIRAMEVAALKLHDEELLKECYNLGRKNITVPEDRNQLQSMLKLYFKLMGDPTNGGLVEGNVHRA